MWLGQKFLKDSKNLQRCHSLYKQYEICFEASNWGRIFEDGLKNSQVSSKVQEDVFQAATEFMKFLRDYNVPHFMLRSENKGRLFVLYVSCQLIGKEFSQNYFSNNISFYHYTYQYFNLILSFIYRSSEDWIRFLKLTWQIARWPEEVNTDQCHKN